MHRVEVRLKTHLPDARGQGLAKDIQDLGIIKRLLHTIANGMIIILCFNECDREIGFIKQNIIRSLLFTMLGMESFNMNSAVSECNFLTYLMF